MKNGSDAALKTLIQVPFSSALNLRELEHAQACGAALRLRTKKWQEIGLKRYAVTHSFVRVTHIYKLRHTHGEL